MYAVELWLHVNGWHTKYYKSTINQLSRPCSSKVGQMPRSNKGYNSVKIRRIYFRAQNSIPNVKALAYTFLRHFVHKVMFQCFPGAGPV